MSNLEFLDSPPVAPVDLAGATPSPPIERPYTAPVLAQLGIGSTNQPRLLANLPQSISQFQAKYTRWGPTLAQLDPATRNALIQYDASRVAQGSRPLGDDETRGALNTVINQEPATPRPDRKPLDILGNFRSDLGAIVGSIPRLPTALYHELTGVGKFGEHLEQAAAEGVNPITALATAPGIRLIPGSYVVGNLAEGDFKELVTHPLFTGLDVLPYVSKLAAATKVGRAAAALAEETGVATRPIPTALTRTLSDTGEIVPNRLGAATLALRRSTGVGQKLDEFFGRLNRDFMSFRGNKQVDMVQQLQGRANQTDDLARMASQLNELPTKYGISPERDIALHDYAIRGDPKEISTLPPNEQAYIFDARRGIDEIGMRNAATDNIGHFVDDEGLSEFYPMQQYKSLELARNTRNQAQLHADLSREIIRPTQDPNLYLQSALDAARSPRVTGDVLGAGVPSSTRTLEMIRTGQRSVGDIRLQVRSNLKALDSAGYDVSDLERIQTIAHRTHDWEPMAQALESAMQQPLRPRPILPLADIMQSLRKYQRSDRLVYALSHAIEDGRWTRVTKILDAIMSRYGPSVVPEFQDFTFVDSLRRHRNTSRFLESNLPDPYKAALKASDAFEQTYTETFPARYTHLIRQETERRLIRTASEYAHATTPEAVQHITDLVLRKAWASLPEEDWANLYMRTAEEVAATWRDMRQVGLDPLFLKEVNPATAFSIEGGTIAEVPTTVSQFRERALNATPGIRSLHLAVSAQGAELLARRASEEVAQYVAKVGTKLEDLKPAYQAAADDLMRKDPRLGYDAAFQQAMKKDWTKFDPAESGYNWGSPVLNQITQDQVMIPNALANNMKRIHEPKAILGGALDPVTKLFRMSVVGLSPRTQLYNILGGAVMMMGETGPSAFRYAEDAWKMVRNPELAPEGLRTVIGQQKEVFKDLDKLSASGKAQTVASYAYGKTLRRFWEETQAAKAGGKLKDAFGKVVDKSYEWNGIIDDWYRAMSYLSGENKALVRGMSKEAAQKAGMEVTRKALMDWVSMTSMERSIMKSIFPFYGFMRHAIGYVLRYPMDHPLRAEILSKFAAAEEADNNDLLPLRFLGLLGIGQPNERGKQNFLNLAPVNPFNDVANMMTLQGFLGATNPVINGILQSAGIDRGQVELYPSLRYDPQSGRLTASHGNPLLNILSATIPQSDIITSLAGFNSEFRDTMQRDPAAAIRSLASSAGLPIPYRAYNVPLEQMRAEVARQSAATEVEQSALKSGNWTNAMRYPSLRDHFAHVANLSPEEQTLYAANSVTPKTLAEMVAMVPVGPGTGAVDA